MKKEEVRIGLPVIYWSEKKEGGELSDPHNTTVISKPIELVGGKVVCRVACEKENVDIWQLTTVVH